MLRASIIILVMVVGILMYQEDGLRREAEALRQKNVELEAQYLDELNRRESLDKEIEMISEVESDVAYVMDVEITHYTHTGNNTASGVYPLAGRTVACNFLPMGTRIRIGGHVYVVEDTGGMSGNTVDIFVDTYEEAIQLGRQYKTMEVLK
jgi:3D (Asp-Asp-Asp) domain-containing protein|nr:MAG TPA: lytic transglycosylase [Caudoviricetes sp.]